MSAQQSRATKMPEVPANQWNRVAELLVKFRKAKIELDKSWATFSKEDRRNGALLRKATERAAAMELDAGITRSEQWLQERRNGISQRPAFVRAYEWQMCAKTAVRDLRNQLQQPLSALAVRHAEIRVVLKRLDRLPLQPSTQSVDIIIGMLEEVVNSSPETKALTDRSGARSAWLDARLAESASMSSDVELARNARLAYNTIRRYRSGAPSTRDRYARQRLASAFGCPVADVPE